LKNSDVICILAKNPKPGKVKVQLESCLGNKQAALFSRALLMDIISTALKVTRASVAIAFCPVESKNDFEDILFLFQNEETNKKIARKAAEISLLPQMGESFGDRIKCLSQLLFDGGAGRIIFICSDNPLLDATILKASFKLLKDHKVIVGPTFDSGFYILGMDGHYPTLFDGINWDAGNVYKQIVEKLCLNRISWLELELSYDIDRPEELEQLYCDIDNLRLTGKNDICFHTEKYLANLKK
jgi:uncharacterized protein